MRSWRAEHVGFAAASLVMLGSATWFGWRSAGGVSGSSGASPVRVDSTLLYQRVHETNPSSAAQLWTEPRAQRRGKLWVYDVFTAPEIFYDERTKAFSVTAPLAKAEATPQRPPFELILVGVEHPLFPLQLVGYAGAEGSQRGVFENIATTETFLAAASRPVPELGLTILSLDVRRIQVAHDENTSAQTIALARVRDERTGEITELTSAERRFTAAPRAWLRLNGSDEHPRELEEGDTWVAPHGSYRVDKIQLLPPLAVITREAAGEFPAEQNSLTVTDPVLLSSGSTASP